jgi:hypothetical protein
VSTRYRINRPRVIAQEIDGEVVAIDLHTGNYYSLRGSAAQIWEVLEGGASAAEVAAALTGRYDVEDGELPDAVESFVQQLVSEELLAPAPEEAPHPVPPGQAAAPGETFEAPVLEKFEDMQDLILLDPVHEVAAEQGWPNRQ